VLHSPGHSLDAASRQFIEPRLRHDFSAVQVHSDSQAAASARSVGALAYTVGSHIVFGQDLYRPATPQGRMLLAHELAHVVQQSRGNSGAGDSVSILEAAADRAAVALLHPNASAVSVDGATAPRLLCQNKPPDVAGTGTVSAMTPEDMYNKLIAMRGFDEAIPVAKLDATKEKLAEMEAQLKTSTDPQLRRQYNRLLSQYNISTFEAAGGPAGYGYNTYAIVQVVGPDGKIIAVADGKYTGGLHAEQIALQKIDAQLGGQAIPGSRIDVVSDKVVCPGECVPAFKAFAEKYNVGKVDAHVFRRQRVAGTGSASEKTTARTATKASSEGLTPTRQSETIVSRPSVSGTTPPATTTGGGSPGSARTINDPAANAADSEVSPRVRVATGTGAEGDTAPRVRVATGTEGEGTTRTRVATDESAESEGNPRVRVATGENEETSSTGLGGAVREGEASESVLGGAAKSALKSAAVSIGTGVAMSILQDWFKQKVLDDLAALPQPRPDKRTARAYLSDPKTKNGVRALDVLAQNLGPFSADLATEQAKISSTRFAQLIATTVMPEKTTDDYEKKLHRLDELQNGLDAWEQELLTIDSNLDALLELEGQLKQTAQAAQDLKKMLSLIGVADELIKMGFSYEEYIDLLTVLDNVSNQVATTMANARKAKEAVRKALNQTADFDHQVNQLWWQEFGGQVNRLVKDADQARRQAQQRSMQRTKIKYGSLEGLEPLHLWNSDQQGMWYFYKNRESEIIFQLNEVTKGAANSQDAFNRKVALEAELGRVRQKMLEMRSGVGSAAP
jgi:hypothetical protein